MVDQRVMPDYKGGSRLVGGVCRKNWWWWWDKKRRQIVSRAWSMFALGFYAGRACCERLNMRSEYVKRWGSLFPSYVIPSCKKLWCDNIVLHRSLLPNPPSPSIGICFTSRTRSGPISSMDHYFRQLVLPHEQTWLAPGVQFSFDQIVCTRPQTFFLGPELHPPKRFSDHNVL